MGCGARRGEAAAGLWAGGVGDGWAVLQKPRGPPPRLRRQRALRQWDGMMPMMLEVKEGQVALGLLAAKPAAAMAA